MSEREYVKLIFSVVVVVLVAIARWIADGLDRERIRDQVGRSGGKLISIKWSPFGKGWWGSIDRIYDVRYTSRHGKPVEASCKTSMFSSVYWASDHPPEGFGYTVSDEPAEPNTPAEPISCLSCGASIPARDRRCPKCGWSYQSQ
ncbi:MAG TPA: hypothetical protein VKE93_10010 [Candidatus Angelobacter sp.]|nr:hypothetical protein [Candidatus Angelobacter sp.]